MHPALEALFHTLENPLSHKFETNKRIIFLKAEAHPHLRTLANGHTVHVSQTFKPAALSLEHAGFNLLEHDTLTQNEGTYDVALILASRHREETQALLAQACTLLKEGGLCVAAQHNNFGAKMLEKDMTPLFPSVQTHSKKHCRVIWAEKTTTAPLYPQTHANYSQHQSAILVPEVSLKAKAGLFSHKGVDVGSALLAKVITENAASTKPAFKGLGADLGAGWGFLSHSLLQAHPATEALHLFEAENQALTLAAENLAPYTERTKYHWVDVTTFTFKPMYNFVISNPPQHGLHHNNPALPEIFIAQAAKALRPRGSLWLVVNQHLKVEKALAKHFKRVTQIALEKGYKVFEAIK